MQSDIQFIDSLEDPPERKEIITALRAYNSEKAGAANYRVLTFVKKSESGTLVAGASGYTMWNWLFISHIFVADSERGKGLGSHFLSLVETEAVKRGCEYCYLDTFEFQALGFYLKKGYELFGTLDKFPGEQHRYFLKRKLGN